MNKLRSLQLVYDWKKCYFTAEKWVLRSTSSMLALPTEFRFPESMVVAPTVENEKKLENFVLSKRRKILKIVFLWLVLSPYFKQSSNNELFLCVKRAKNVRFFVTVI